MSKRILSLDVFRGLTMVLMILVNYQLSTSAYPLLVHVDWNGWSLADLVFPSFLFIVGLTLVLALKNHQHNGENRHALYGDILKRSCILFLIGICLNFFPFSPLSVLRYYGILQRIAVCYLICSFIYLNTSIKTQGLIFISILISYWLIMTQVPVPGHGVSQLTPVDSWVSYFDQFLFSANHLYGKTYDPEGFFSTLPSIATTLLGVLIGQLMFNTTLTNYKKLCLMVCIGIISLVLGEIWSWYFPINKNLWTSSFVLLAGGFSLLTFAFCFFLIDILGYKKWAEPFKIMGMNALFIFVFHVLLIRMQVFYKVDTTDGAINLKQFIIEHCFSYFNPANAVLAYSLCFLLINFLVALYFYRNKIFIRL